jgi:iron complex transport system substrate-binding protein
VDAGAPARRIVSLVPSATETLFALGAGDRVVGVSAFCDYPPEVTRLPRVGGLVNPSFEAIMALHPDALVGVQGPLNRAVIDRVEAAGVRTLFPKVESVAEVFTSVDAFAQLLGDASAGQALKRRIEAELSAVRRAVQGRPAPRVVAVFAQRPLVVAAAGSWVDEVLTLAGGRNAITAARPYPMISLEQFLAAQPEVVLDLSWQESSGEVALALAPYPTLPAVRDHRIVRITDPAVVRQGPRIGLAARLIARVLHPAAGL